MANETPEQRQKWQELAEIAKRKQNADLSSLDIETDGVFEGEVFDHVKYVTDNFITDSSFIAEQQKLHSMNALNGHIFNPLGLYASVNGGIELFDDSPALNQLINQVGSDLIGNGGAFGTTDGKTFDRVLDNDADSLFFHSVQTFADEVSNGLSFGDKMLNSAVNTVGQAIGVQGAPTRSIIAQALAYKQVKGGESYANEEGAVQNAIKIDPMGSNALSYIYGNQSEVARKAKEELSKLIGWNRSYEVSQNYRIKKDSSIIDIGRKKSKLNRFKQFAKQFGKQLANNASQALLGVNIYGDESNRYYTNWTKKDSEFLMLFYSKLFGEESNFNVESQINNEDGYASMTKLTNDDIGKISIDNILEKNLDSTYDGNPSPKKASPPEDLNLDDPLSSNNPLDHRNPEIFKSDKAYTKRTGGFKELATENFELYKDYNPSKYDRNNADGINRFTNDTQGYIGDYGNKSYPNIAKIYDITKKSHENGNSFKKFGEREIESDIILSSDVLDDNTSDYDDIIHMSFQDVRNNKIIYLRPTVESISDAYQVAQGGEELYIGRTEPIPEYQQTTRNISLSFMLYCRTPREYLINMKKMDFLRSLAYPEAISPTNFTTVKNPILRFTLGDQYKNIGGALNSITFDPDVNSTWEISKGVMGAKIINASLSFSVIHDTMPMVYKDNNFDTTLNDGTQFSQQGINYTEFIN